MPTLRVRARLRKKGELRLSNLPFAEGEEVEVTLTRTDENKERKLSEFWHSPSHDEIASNHAGGRPCVITGMVQGWPDNDSVDDFLQARDVWRSQDLKMQNGRPAD